ncbi:MAG: twin-arginine translocase subunit TatC [Sporichthyaceae bacterium]
MTAGTGSPDIRGSASDAGRMPLLEHIRELRTRLVRSMLAIVLGAIVGWYLYDWIVDVLVEPVCNPKFRGVGQGRCGPLVISGIVGAFSLQIKVALFAGIALAAPIWLYQLWAFLAPGLHRHEKRWAYAVAGFGVPLFAIGAGLAYLILPNAVEFLLGFTPAEASNQVPLGDYLNFVLRLLFVFGVSFELPLIIVMANLAGILSASRIRKMWRGMVFGIAVFAAVATPTGDPGTMLALATPMTFLYLVSIAITTLVDRRRKRRAAA